MDNKEMELKAHSSKLGIADLLSNNFIKVGEGTFVHPDYRIAIWKPYWNTSVYKVEMEGCSFNISNHGDLIALMTHLINGVPLLKYKWNNLVSIDNKN